MVMRLACLLCVMLVAPVTATALSISADETRVQYGKPVWLTIESAQRDVPLQGLDFSRWRDEVAVFSEREVQTDAAGVQRWRVRLYPRREGRIELPGLMFAGARSAALALDAVQPVDAKTGTAIGIDCNTSTHTPYQQQQVLVACAVQLQDEHVLFDYPRHALAGAQLLPMQVTRAPAMLHQAGWVVIPQRSGSVEYDLPPLQLVRDGVITHRFYLPRMRLEVQPLPVYLPGTIPVGRVQVTRYALAGALLRPATLSNLQLHVTVSGVPDEAVPDYAQGVHSDAWLQTYAAKTRQVQRVNAQGIQHEIEYSIPVTPRRQGVHALPALRLQYFDPHSGTLQSLQVPGPRVLILGFWARLVVLVLALALLLLGGRYLYRVARQGVRRWRTYRAALAQLDSEPTLAGIRRAMQLMAQAEGWSANLTYRQWCEKMTHRLQAAADFPCRRLNEAAYAGVVHDLHAVRESLQRMCRRRMYTILAKTG